MNKTNWISILILICFIITSLSAKSQTLSEEMEAIADIIVDKNGSGDYLTVIEGIQAVPDNSTETTIVFIKKGIYREKVVLNYKKANVILVGEGADNTVISYDDYGNKMLVNGDPAVGGHTFSTYTFRADAHNFQAYNIQFRNPTTSGQGVAFHSNGDKQVLYHCKITGNQDTYFDNFRTRRYIKDCFVEGGVDFIFGFGVTLFDSCQIHSNRDGYITASSTPQYYNFGHVFKNCKLTQAPGISGISLGRPWFDYANTVFYECWLTDAIKSAGWTEWGGRESTCYYREYNNIGPGYDYSNRVSFGKQLTPEEASAYTIGTIFGANNFPSNMGPEVDAKEFALMRDRHEAAGYVARADTILYAGRDTFPEYPKDDWMPDFNNDVKSITDKYSIPFLNVSNTELSVSKILINGGEMIGFDSGITSYCVELPSATSDMPEIDFEGLAVLSVNYPDQLPGFAKLTFQSGDRTQREDYSIYLSTDSAYWETEVQMIVVNRVDTIFVLPGKFEYKAILAEGKTRLNNLDITPKNPDQSIRKVPPSSIPGICSVIVTAPDGVSTATYILYVGLFTSIESSIKDEKSIIAINPVNDELLLFSEDSRNTTIEISVYDIKGKIIKNGNLKGLNPGLNPTGIFMKQYSGGTYFYRIKNKDEVYKGSFMKLN